MYYLIIGFIFLGSFVGSPRKLIASEIAGTDGPVLRSLTPWPEGTPDDSHYARLFLTQKTPVGNAISLDVSASKGFPPKQAEKIISGRSEELIDCLRKQDFEKLSKFIHPIKGVRFSPYGYVSPKNDVVLNASQIKQIANDETKRVWGTEDGSGDPINCSFIKYFFRFIYDRDFKKAPKISFNEIHHRGLVSNNIYEFFPGAIVVECYFPGTPNPKDEGRELNDWKFLWLVFEKANDSQWYLVDIAHGQWTI